MLRFLAIFISLLLLANTSFAQTVRSEKEPNDIREQANLINLGEIVQGVIQVPGDNDIFKIQLPKEGNIKVRVWGFPDDCPMDIFVTAGGLHNRTATWIQRNWKPGQPLELLFNTYVYKEIYLYAGLSHYHMKTCHNGHCFMRCSPDGPWYLTFEKGEPKNIPPTYQNRPVKSPITYYLVVTYADQTLPPSEPPTKPYSEPATQPPPQKIELIKNGNFSQGSNWEIHDWYNPSQGKGEVFFESDGVKFLSRSGNNRIGILQRIRTDVRQCKSLIISATVRVDQQTLTGTGYNGREAPIAVFMHYTDEKGNVHRYLWENPYDTSQKMFWHGFYYLDPVSPSISVHGTKVQRGVWYNYSYDLMKLNPRPVYVEFVGAEGAGWAVREGKINRLSLTCER